jgi:hypothetical protein
VFALPFSTVGDVREDAGLREWWECKHFPTVQRDPKSAELSPNSVVGADSASYNGATYESAEIQ